MTKKELKQPDEIMTYLGTLTKFLSEQRTKAAVFVLAALLLVTAIYGYRAYVYQMYMRENGKLWSIVSKIPENIRNETEKQQQDLILVKSELEDFSSKLRSKSVRLYTRYYIANVNYRLGYSTNAVEEFRHILDEEEVPEELRYISNLGLGYSYETLNKYEEAIQSYRTAENIAVGSYNKGSALYGMARCYELMGNMDMARKIYTDIIEKTPDYLDIEFIKIRLSTIS
jgi:tetratricopeptide (TPR) repeat protein